MQTIDAQSTGGTISPMTRLLIADDHPIFVRGLMKVLEGRTRYTVVARSADGEEALFHLRSKDLDIAVVDISMPKLTGFDVVAAARAEQLDVKFIMLTMYDDPVYLRRAQELQVEGYVLKESASDELLKALEAVSRGSSFVSEALREDEPSSGDNGGPLDLKLLSPAERKVLRELGKNRTSREIAESLTVSYRTVQNHRANICAKLGLRGANRLLQFALQNRDRL